MPEDVNKKYFEILEVSPDASLSEIKNAYLRLKKLYSSDSMVVIPIADEFSKRNREEILKKIENAYTKLIALMDTEKSKPVTQRKPSVSDIPSEKHTESVSFSGEALRQIREKKGVQLYEVALETKIRIELLQNIELENFEALPAGIYLKAHLMNYASFLSLDAKKVAEDYIRRYEEQKKESEE
ncbi:MAG: helix-turn-helix domain-containing protein [Candidatus Aminicenantes bacterium]|nr:MAG: helix-turn-helix domain-containing protein [Candidatus Aminicenantes bacterium]